MTMPVTVKYAVVVCEEDELVTFAQRLGDADIPRSGRSAVCLQGHVFHVAGCQGVLERAGVIHNVHTREESGLVAHAFE